MRSWKALVGEGALVDAVWQKPIYFNFTVCEWADGRVKSSEFQNLIIHIWAIYENMRNEKIEPWVPDPALTRCTHLPHASTHFSKPEPIITAQIPCLFSGLTWGREEKKKQQCARHGT